MILGRKQILSAKSADDKSRNWRDWSCSKQERERDRIPELDKYLRSIEDDISNAIKDHATVMRLIDPEYCSGNRINQMAVYARLGRAFNMSPSEVMGMGTDHLYGLVRALILDEKKQQSQVQRESTQATGAPAVERPTHLLPLADSEVLVFDLLNDLPKGKALDAKDIAQALARAGKVAPSPSSISKMLKSEAMIQRGFKNRPRAGYYVENPAGKYGKVTESMVHQSVGSATENSRHETTSHIVSGAGAGSKDQRPAIRTGDGKATRRARR